MPHYNAQNQLTFVYCYGNGLFSLVVATVLL